MPRNFNENLPKLGDAQTILESITDAFFFLNDNWEFSYVNRQTEKVLGRQASELLGQSIWEVYPGTVGSDFEKMYRKAAQERITLTFSSYYPDHDRWYEVNVYPAQDGLSIYFRDISSRMREEARRDALITLNDIFRDLAVPEEIIYKGSEVLGKTLRVSRVGYGTFDPVAETLHVVRDWNAPGVESLAGALNLRDYGSFIDNLKAGEFIAINDVDLDHRTAAASSALKGRSAGSFVNVPVIEQNCLVAIIFINHAEVRNWSTEELAFIKDVAERTRTASERARNEQELARFVAESERRRRLYETFLENSPDLAYVFDLNHRFTYANKVLLNMWSRTWEEAIGKNCLELGYEPWHAEMHDREIQQVIATKKSIRGEVPFAGAFGRRIYDYIFVPVIGPDGEVEAVAGTTRDVTDRKQTEEAVLEENRRKDEFLAMLAHELRNPLAPIGAAAELLQMVKLDDARVRQTSKIIDRQVKHMTSLVDDLLDVSRVTRGLIELDNKALDVSEIVTEAIEQVTPLIRSRRHRLSLHMTSDATIVLGDKKRLVQVLGNILNNAAKYTDEGGTIQLSTEVDESHVFIKIADNGMGMASELAERAFDLFVQAERTADRSSGGLGLGLALVKSLVELHHGTVRCESEGLGMGSKFIVCLPRFLAPEGHGNQQQHEAESQNPMQALRILVVDDNVDAATMLAMLLETAGHEVLIEHGSREALKRAIKERPQVCLLDIGLPELDGNELAQRLRAQAETANAVLVAVTGYGQEKDQKRTLVAGFDHHFVKPVDTGRLLELLAKVGAR